MKKGLCIFLSVAMMFAGVACGSNEPPVVDVTGKETEQEVQAENQTDIKETAEDNGVKNDDEIRETEVQEGEEETKPLTYYENYTKNGVAPSLCEAYKDNFLFGAALEEKDLANPEEVEMIKQNFVTLTCGNEMKADFTLDHDASVKNGDETRALLDMTRADTILTFAKENGKVMRGHTLVWHSQVPRWFFTEGYSQEADAPFVTKEVMLQRMENYIQDVVTYCNTNYPGVIYAWDVVNEVFEPSQGEENGLRTGSLWYEVIGPEYIEKAFEYARKYADPSQKLFLNDYNCYESGKRFRIKNMLAKLVEQGNIDGIGMQSHIGLDSPSTMDFQDAAIEFTSLGLELQITELDVNTTDNTKEGQVKLAQRYQKFFNMLNRLENYYGVNLTSVTIWGITDKYSWLAYDGPNFPLLFDRNMDYKPAYWGVFPDDSLKKMEEDAAQ